MGDDYFKCRRCGVIVHQDAGCFSCIECPVPHRFCERCWPFKLVRFEARCEGDACVTEVSKLLDEDVYEYYKEHDRLSESSSAAGD
jgi:hypothetical protein